MSTSRNSLQAAVLHDFALSIGVLSRKVNIKIKFNTLIVLLLILFLFSVRHEQVDIRVSIFPSLLSIVTSGLLGFYFVLMLSERITSVSYINKFFIYLGENSFIVMALHILSFKAVSFVFVSLTGASYELLNTFGIVDSNVFWRFIYLFIGIGIPLFINIIINLIFIKKENIALR